MRPLFYLTSDTFDTETGPFQIFVTNFYGDYNYVIEQLFDFKMRKYDIVIDSVTWYYNWDLPSILDMTDAWSIDMKDVTISDNWLESKWGLTLSLINMDYVYTNVYFDGLYVTKANDF